jgi:arylsulfatase A-like enzyme
VFAGAIGAAVYLQRSFLRAPPSLPSFGPAQLHRINFADESRLALAAPAPRLPFNVPPRAVVLRLAFGLIGFASTGPLETIDFIVAFHFGNERRVLLKRRLERGGGNTWHDVAQRLDGVQGKSGELRLETEVVKGQLAHQRAVIWTPPVLESVSSDERPNIVLVSIDTLRADRLGCYGYRRDTTPNIDNLARTGVLFRQAIASSNWTLPSHASMLTGLNPNRHGAVRFPRGTRIAPAVDTLAELLRNAGYATGGFTEGGFVSPLYGFDRGFDIYAYGRSGELPDGKNDFERSVERASDWIRATQPFFLFLHTYAVHVPYAPRAPYDRLFDPDYSGPCRSKVDPLKPSDCITDGQAAPRVLEHFKALYDGEIRQMDAAFGHFIEQLHASGLAERTCVILTSDHGEEFMEHGKLFHGRIDLYDELLRVPLVVWCPARFPGGRVVDDPVSSIDIAPTILEMAGVPLPKVMDGESLLPVLRDGTSPQRGVTLSEVDRSMKSRDLRGTTVSVRTAEYKLMMSTWEDAPRLFDLRTDPGETWEISQSSPDVVARLKRVLPVSIASLASTNGAESGPVAATPDRSTMERLRALGYLPEAEDHGSDAAMF